jgi:hypothetical protein
MAVPEAPYLVGHGVLSPQQVRTENAPQGFVDCRRRGEIPNTLDRRQVFASLPLCREHSLHVRNAKLANTSERSDGLAVFANSFRQADPFS